MRTMKWILMVVLSCLTGCNYTVGQCWIDDQGGVGSGGGGGPVVPYGGAGGYGDAPDKEPQAETDPPECNLIGSYDASLFKFKTMVEDDGTGLAGGWQVATATVQFVDGRQDPPAGWSCSITVGMAIRSETRGKISTAQAATMTAEVLTDMASYTMHSRDAWVGASFCKQLAMNMEKYFKKRYSGTGATVSAQ